MGAYKSPGPDGFQPLFYQKFWNIVKQDLHHLVKTAFEHAYFPRKLNETYLHLIPKVDQPDNMKLFRPIGLCNVSYQIITKVLASRLKPILARIIGHTQNSFLPGRQTRDNIIVAQELIHTMCNMKGKTGVLGTGQAERI